MNLQQKALKANGNSRACGTCKLRSICNTEISEWCRDVFVEGFKKGFNKCKKEQDERIGSILHAADEPVGGKDVYVFFRDVRGKENKAFPKRTRFIKPEKEQSIGTIQWKPEIEGAPQQLPIAWCNENDLLNLLGYNKRFKSLEKISLREGSFAYPTHEYLANLKKYESFREGGK